MEYVFAVAEPASVALAGREERLPVRRIFCVGRNYAAHAREFGNDPDRDPPFFFTKPADAVVESGVDVAYPPMTSDLHFEAELVVVIGKTGTEIDAEVALDHVWGYAVGNDLTRRDLQAQAKEMRRPWDMSKGFDASAVIGPVHAAEDVGHLANGSIECHVNGVVKQSADLEDQIWAVPDMVAYLSRFVTIQPGDLIMTGTPAGVGPLVKGDVCVVKIEGLGAIETTIR